MHTIDLTKKFHYIWSFISEFSNQFFNEVSHAIGLKAQMTSRTQILNAKQ